MASGLEEVGNQENLHLESKAIAKRYDSAFFQSVETPENRFFVRNCACHSVYGVILSLQATAPFPSPICRCL
jgi:hypothetical protein